MAKSILVLYTSIILIINTAAALALSDTGLPDGYTVAANGLFSNAETSDDYKVYSENGRFAGDYEIVSVSDENRILKNFRLYDNGQLLYEIAEVLGSDMYISNSGVVAFLNHTFHFRGELTAHFYSAAGQLMFTRAFKDAALFGFSPSGNEFGVGDSEGISVISIANQQTRLYNQGCKFAFAENENIIAIASENKLRIYDGNQLLRELTTGFVYTRKIAISSTDGIIAAIDKNHLKVFSLNGGQILFTDEISDGKSFRDLLITDNGIAAGIHFRDKNISSGKIKLYDFAGQVLLEKEIAKKEIKSYGDYTPSDKPTTTYDQIPWPFAPYDSMCTVWDYYEQHMGYFWEIWSYLHQGLDLITPIGEPVYAVQPGVVKLVLTLGGDIYWRTAISPEQSEGWSDGWLYAHLIENTIQVDVGDTVQLHDYLGDIIQWYDDWGHIHFVEINDTGTVWSYTDNEWGINYNPLLSLVPNTDTIPPVIENVFTNSKFAFCTNETSDYLDPDSLYGDIDIITKVNDYVNDSPWSLPAFETYYWFTDIATGDTVVPRTLGQILNHTYSFFATAHFEEYATLLYKCDDLLVPTSWMEYERNYYHNLTNNNGDSIAELAEKDLAFATENYPDGNYRLFVEAKDAYGNAVIDSQDVRFVNGNVGIADESSDLPDDYLLSGNYPNPFNPSTTIYFELLSASQVTLKVFDILGREVTTLVDDYYLAGHYSIIWNGQNAAGDDLPSGIYFYQINAGDYKLSKKMSLLK